MPAQPRWHSLSFCGHCWPPSPQVPQYCSPCRHCLLFPGPEEPSALSPSHFHSRQNSTVMPEAQVPHPTAALTTGTKMGKNPPTLSSLNPKVKEHPQIAWSMGMSVCLQEPGLSQGGVGPEGGSAINTAMQPAQDPAGRQEPRDCATAAPWGWVPSPPRSEPRGL